MPFTNALQCNRAAKPQVGCLFNKGNLCKMVEVAAPLPLLPAPQLTPVEHTLIGAMAGVIEVSIMQPTVAVKNALQEGRPVPRHPLTLYRGLGINAASIAPITAVQFGANRFFEQTLVSLRGHDLHQGERILVAAAAGGTSASLSCPAELIMIQQQRTGLSFLGATRHVLSQFGALRLYRGLEPTLMRESLYTASYLGLCPVLQEYLAQQAVMLSYPSQTPMIMAGITAGLFAACATQPADTVKTRMQAFLDTKAHPEYRTTSSTVRHIVSTQGVSGLWSGLAPRAVRIVGATFILNAARTQLISVFEKHKAH